MLSPLLLAVAALLITAQHHVAAQSTGTSFVGTTVCTWTFAQANKAFTEFISWSGYVTLNLTAGALVVPNAPGQTVPEQSYPIIAIAANRTDTRINTATIPPTVTNLISTTNTLVNPALIYATISPSAVSLDANFQFDLDYTGFNVSMIPAAYHKIALFAESANNAYAEDSNTDTTVWNGGNFQVTGCTNNSYTVVQQTPPSARGDPMFTGMLGQTYQIHGVDGGIYSIISDKFVQVNALFTFLSSGSCAEVNGKVLGSCWSHPGSYFGAISFMTSNGDRLLLKSGTAAVGFASVLLNDEEIAVGKSVSGVSGDHQLVLNRLDSHTVSVQTSLYSFVLQNSDNFINLLSVEIEDWKQLTSVVKPSGLLGGSWQKLKGHIQGTVDDYVEANNDLFGSKFLYNKFA